MDTEVRHLADLGTPADRAHQGAIWLDEQRPTWFLELDLKRLNLMESCHCVLGQFVRSETSKWLNAADIVVGPRDEYVRRLSVINTYGDSYGAVLADHDGQDIEGRRAALSQIDGLADVILTMQEAIERGFHIATLSAGYDHSEDYEHWCALTDAWRTEAACRRAGYEYAISVLRATEGIDSTSANLYADGLREHADTKKLNGSV